MSEAVTDPQVDLLLSSVRQIVGDDSRRRQVASGRNSDNVASQRRIDSDTPEVPFVLTSHFRVRRAPLLRLTDAVSEAEQANVPSSQRVEPHPRADVQALMAKITALEASLAESVKNWETVQAPDSSTAARGVTSAPDRAEREEGAKVHHLDASRGMPRLSADNEQPHGDAVAHGGRSSLVPKSPESSVIDHQALRALVADIVRAELCGEGSGLVARQMRSLIRQEVRRALASERRA